MTAVFDIDRVRNELHLPMEVFAELAREAREEFPDDEMMYELHLVRAMRAYSQKGPGSKVA